MKRKPTCPYCGSTNCNLTMKDFKEPKKQPNHMKNLPEFKALIERYESITIEEIEAEDKTPCCFDSEDIMKNLTGFGSILTCTLCKAINVDCINCVYYNGLHSAAPCADNKTYHAIFDADTPTELLQAIRNRAAYMRTLIP